MTWVNRQEDVEGGMRMLTWSILALAVAGIIIMCLLARSCILLAEDNRALQAELVAEIQRANAYQAQWQDCREVGIQWHKTPQRAALTAVRKP